MASPWVSDKLYGFFLLLPPQEATQHFVDVVPSTQVVRLILSWPWGALNDGGNSQNATRIWAAAASPLHLG